MKIKNTEWYDQVAVTFCVRNEKRENSKGKEEGRKNVAGRKRERKPPGPRWYVQVHLAKQVTPLFSSLLLGKMHRLYALEPSNERGRMRTGGRVAIAR